MEDLSLKICRSSYFDTLESANEAFGIPRLFAELRFDLCSIPLEGILNLELPEKLIFTCRLGTHSHQYRLKAYSYAIEREVDYIDLDLETDLDLVRSLDSKITKSKTQLILSQHNYVDTPDLITLKDNAHKAFDLGADIAKIITMANSVSDLDNIYALYQRFDDVVAFAMGEIGTESRAKILTLGAPFTYAAYSEKENTAPGQLNFQQTVDLYRKLKAEII